MVINIFFELVKGLLTTVLGFLPSLPDIPTAFSSVMDTFSAYLEYGMLFFVKLLGLSYIQVIFPIFILLINFKWIYHGTMWIIKKLPIGAQ